MMELYSHKYPEGAENLPEAHLLATIPITIPGGPSKYAEIWRIDPDSWDDKYGDVDLLQFIPYEYLGFVTDDEFDAAEAETPTWIVRSTLPNSMPFYAGRKALGIYLEAFGIPRFDR